MKSSTLLLLFTLIAKIAFSQNSSIKGKVIDKSTGETLIGVAVVIQGKSIGAITDLEGEYIINNVIPGTYTLECAYISYTTKTIENVSVKESTPTIVNIELESVGIEAETVEITATRLTHTEGAVVQEIKSSDQVVSGMSSDQIQKGQDRNAAQVVRRIAGVSIVDDKFIMVRGLNDRYNSVWLNGAVAPSTETDKKSFSFDMLPSALIDRIMVYKTPAPELPGDFAGGMVKVYTRNSISSEKLIISVGTAFRPGSTFKTFQGDHGKMDWLGMDDGHRGLPDNLPAIKSSLTADQKEQLAAKFENNWILKTSKPFFDGRLSATYSENIKLFKKNITSISALNYSNVHTTYDISRKVFDINGSKSNDVNDIQYTNDVRWGFIQNFSMLLNANNKFEFTNFINQNGTNQFTDRNTLDLTGNQTEKNYAISYESKRVINSQLNAKHTFNKEKTEINWLAGYSSVMKDAPDLRRLSYQVKAITPDSSVYTALTPAPGQVDIIRAGRLYQKLNETNVTAAVNFIQKIIINEKEYQLKIGTYQEVKSRTFNARAFGYSPHNLAAYNQVLQYLPIDSIFSSAHIGSPNGFQILEDINSTYTYVASNNLSAYYLSGSGFIGEKIKISGGARYEHNNQGIKSAVNFSRVDTNIVSDFILPSINTSYNFSQKSLLRLAYGKTLNRPQFREWAPFYYYDFNFNALNYGSLYLDPMNPLKVATINNYDIRYEYYPTPSEMISLAVFYKDFKNPIESVVIPTTNLAYTYANAVSAYTEGIELDIKKNIGFLDSLTSSHFFEKLSVLFNASLIKSRVTMGPGVISWNPERSMQGQSPYVYNGGLYYNDDSLGLSFSILYNVFGPRIVYVGSDQYPDVVEMPRNTLDVSISKKLSKRISVNLAVQNILNAQYVFLQDYDNNGKYEKDKDSQLLSYRQGPYYSLAFKFNF